jgi:hypothetical protein
VPGYDGAVRLREAAAKAGASAQEVTGPSDATRGPEPAEAVLGDARLEVPSAGGSEPGSIAMTQVIIETAEAETSIHDVGRVDVEKVKGGGGGIARGGARGGAAGVTTSAGGAVAAAGCGTGGGADSRDASPAPRVDPGHDRPYCQRPSF